MPACLPVLPLPRHSPHTTRLPPPPSRIARVHLCLVQTSSPNSLPIFLTQLRSSPHQPSPSASAPGLTAPSLHNFTLPTLEPISASLCLSALPPTPRAPNNIPATFLSSVPYPPFTTHRASPPSPAPSARLFAQPTQAANRPKQPQLHCTAASWNYPSNGARAGAHWATHPRTTKTKYTHICLYYPPGSPGHPRHPASF